jgi:hypothetical protein
MAISPALRNFTLQRGMDWREQYIFKSTQADGSEVPMDLTGYTVASEAWDKDRDCKYATFGVVYDDKQAGKISLVLTDIQTENFPDELYYDVLLTNSNGLKEHYIEGRITVSQGYTR